MDQYLDRRNQRETAVFLAVLCFISYAASYIGRLNYSAALPGMLAEQALTRQYGGVISAAYFASYGAGQLINGLLADRCSPKMQVAAGLAGSAVLNLLMYAADAPPAMLVIWCLNGYAQSLIWAPAFLMVSQGVGPEYRAKALLLLNMAPSAGTMAAYLFSGMILRRRGWNDLFLGASLTLFCTLAVWGLGCGAVPPLRPGRGADGGREKRRPAGREGRGIAASGAALLILPAMINGMLKDGVTSWFPTYMAEEFSLPAETAMTFSVLLPVINIFGAAAGYGLIRRMRNEAACAGALFSGAAVCAALLSFAGGLPPVVSAVLFALMTAVMMAVSVILTCEVPSRFARFGIAASVSGFFNACGYGGTAVSTYGIAWIAGEWGWSAARGMWTAASLLAAALSAAAAPVWGKFLKAQCGSCGE